MDGLLEVNRPSLVLGIGASDLRGFGTVASTLPPQYTGSFSLVQNCYDLQNGSAGWGDLAPFGTEHGFEISFGRTRQAASDRLRTMRYGRDNTGAGTWNSGVHRANALAWALARQAEVTGGNTGKFTVVYWDAVGNECQDLTLATNIGTELTALETFFRSGLGNPRLIFAVRQASTYLPASPYTQTTLVRTNQAAFVAANPTLRRLIDPVGGPGGDGIHSSTATEVSAGELLAAAIPVAPIP